jgi:hypothetical protein
MKKKKTEEKETGEHLQIMFGIHIGSLRAFDDRASKALTE